MASSTYTGILLAAAALLIVCDAACPSIKTWSDRSPTSVQVASRPASRVVIRGGQGQQCSSIFNCPGAIKDLQSIDRADGRPDIDCSVVVGGDGYVYAGRGWDTQTSTFKESVVFCVLKNKNSASYPDNYQTKAINSLLACAAANNKITSGYTVATPRDYDSTSKDPETSLYNWVKQLDRYSAPDSGIVG